MAETIRLNKVLRELNISLDRAVEFLDSKGVEIEKRPTTKISEETYRILSDEFETDANKKVKSQEVSEAKLKEKEDLRIKREKELEAKQKAQEAIEKAKQEVVVKASKTLSGPKQVGKIDLDPKKAEAKAVVPKVIDKEEVVEKPVVEKVEEAPVKTSTPKVEDKAVDLHLFKECLVSKHNNIWEKCWKSFVNGYNNKTVLERLEIVESRGKYKKRN